jgi:hypothetical protein
MSQEQITKLLEEIRDLQKRQLELSQKSHDRYEEAVKRHDKEVGIGKRIQIALFVVLMLFLLFVIYAEWFMGGIPRPSWMK